MVLEYVCTVRLIDSRERQYPEKPESNIFSKNQS